MQHPTVGRLVLFAFSILLLSLAAEAQQPTKVYRIGRLSPGPPMASRALEEAFRQRLRDLGYIEGQNLVIESRYAEGSLERLHGLAEELVRLKVEVIVAGGTSATRAAQHATRTIPIVMAGTFDPLEQGLVTSLAHPGGNITGLSFLSAELPGKRLEILKETIPQSARIAVLAHPATPSYASHLHNLTVAARALGLHLHVVEVHRADELDSAFTAMIQAGADALLVLSDPLLMDSLRGRVTDLAATHRLPAMYDWRMYVEAGGLMAYGPSLSETQRRAATYVDKILKGAKPADLPVERAHKFELIVNLKTAQALGLTIPPTLLFQATDIIR